MAECFSKEIFLFAIEKKKATQSENYAVNNNNELVKEIKDEISYRFDYDNDALIRTFLGRKIAGEKFEVVLSNSSNGKYSSKDIEKMILESGYLQFTFPQNYESLDYESETPLAVPIYSFINEQDTEYLEAFDKDGNTIKLSAKETPNVPVIVVARSERVDENGNMRVSERSVVIPKESRSMHYTDAIKQSRNTLKSAKINQHIVKILSQEEFDKLGAEQESIGIVEYGANLKNADPLFLIPIIKDPSRDQPSGGNLTATTDNPLKITLNWNSYSNGIRSSNRYVVYRDDIELGDLTNSYTLFDIVPEANTVYTYRVKYYYNDEFLTTSNLYKIHSSHRKSGGQEYIDYLYASHAMVVALEGWWVSELEIEWDIYYAKADDQIGQVSIHWWNPNGDVQFLNSDGFKVIINQKP